ncbi:FecR family protein [Flavobacterium sp.]|uniref:FecR family protein n=1 Tax=Flavobacterium sp. TaxID=239 RepID=UPI0039E4C536
MDQKDDTLLARWLSGELSPDELQQLENSPEYPTLLRMKQNFARLQSPRTDDQRILKHVLAQPKIKSAKTIPLYRKAWFAAAAMVVVLLGLAYYFTLPTQHITENGQTLAFALPDQSEVLLNSGSEADYSHWNWDSNRKITLEGEAYFKVAKGKKFTVSTKLGSVTVLGTQFNVRARGKRFDIVCYEGKVQVTSNAGTSILTPGRKITIDYGKTSGIKTIKTTQPEWTQNELVFDNENLSGVLAELERHYNVEIQSELESGQRFSGAVPGNELEAALNIIGATYHLNVSKNGSSVVLTQKK